MKDFLTKAILIFTAILLIFSCLPEVDDVKMNIEISKCINEQSKELESKGKKIFKFGFGQSPFQIPLDIVKELKDNAHQNKYLPMQGLPELRNSIAKYITNIKKYNYKESKRLY